MRDSWLGLRPGQLSGDWNLKLIKWLLGPVYKQVG